MSTRSPGSLRRRLEFTLVGVALISVLLLSGLNYVFARVLISDSVEEQLSALRETRVQSIERGAVRVQAGVSTLAVTPSVVTAFEELSAGYDEVDASLTPAQLGELEAMYDEALQPLRDAGQEVPTASLVPASGSGQFVQYQYIAQNPDVFDERDQLDDAGDGSSYSRAHEEYHSLLRSLMQNAGLSDLMFIDVDTAEVIYSVQKRIDVGTNAVNGPWADNGLRAVVDALATVPIGETVVSDTSFYVPARGQAVFLLATAIRSTGDATGALVAQLPVQALTDLATSGQDWELLGLDETGDVFLVGADGTLRTDAREWLEDPEQFLEEHFDRNGDESLIEQMRLVGSAALTQDVDNRAVEAALGGDTFVGTVTTYDGDTAFAASGPVRIGGLDWAVVIEKDRSEATAGLSSLLRGTLVVMAVLLPVTALLGWWMARSLTRPFGQLVDAAGRVARGEPASGVGNLGNNELGDVGRQLESVAARLEAEEAALVVEEEQINAVLAAVVPPRLVERVRSGEQGIADLVDSATVISFLVDGVPEATGSNQDTVFEITEQLAEGVEQLQEQYGAERIRRSTTSALFATGLGIDEPQIEAAAKFTAAVLQLVQEIGAEYGQRLSVRAGLATGDVASGVIGQQQLAFSMWGEPVTTAFTLASLARTGEILVDAEVHDALGSGWDVERREGLFGLDDTVEAWALRPQRVPDA
jgi:class 3 adenylate cyclase